MKNKDAVLVTREELAQKFNAALASGDEGQVSQALADMAENIQQNVLAEAKQLNNTEQMDVAVLAQRGVRQLTTEEKKFYQSLIGAMKSDSPKQALANLDTSFPKTIIESVFDELTAEHELLAAINFQNTTMVTEWILNKNGKQIAQWGDITAEVEKELTGDFEKLDMILFSLTAFIPVAKSMLDLGASWIDKYVREVLKDALYVGLEEGVVNGTGVKMPVGMNRDVAAAHADGEAYPKKKAVKVTNFAPVTYGALIAKMAKGRNGRARKVAEVILLVNPVDYFAKVMPATTLATPQGTYVNNVLPFPTKVIQCEQVEEGTALLGIADKYFMGMGTGKDGVIEYDDSYKFLQRERVYLAYIYGNGKPLDNNSFLLLDISELQTANYYVSNTAPTAPVFPSDSDATSTSTVDSTVYTEETLTAKTVDEITAIATARGYTLTGSTKADKITSFLAQQNA